MNFSKFFSTKCKFICVFCGQNQLQTITQSQNGARMWLAIVTPILYLKMNDEKKLLKGLQSLKAEKKASPEKLSRPRFYALRAEILGEIWWGNRFHSKTKNGFMKMVLLMQHWCLDCKSHLIASYPLPLSLNTSPLRGYIFMNRKSPSAGKSKKWWYSQLYRVKILFVRIKAHRWHWWTRIISGSKKAHRNHWKHRILDSSILSVSSVSSVWDKKGHTDGTDEHRFFFNVNAH